LAPYPGQARRLTLIRPARKDDEAIPVLPELAAAARRGDHLDTEAPARPRTPRWPHPPVGRWAGIVQRLLALNACTWHNWPIGAPSSAPWSPTTT